MIQRSSRVRPARLPARRWLPAALLVLLTVGALGRVAGHPFVDLDDKKYVTGNPEVRAGLTLHGVRWALTTFTASNWHPLAWLSHMLDVQLFGMRAGGHHATSLAIHAVSAALLYLVLAAMTGAAGRSLAVAALFAVHPLHVESVAWVAERKDVLSGLCFVLVLAAWLRYARRPSVPRYLAAAALLALGLTAKAMLVTVPFVLLLLDWWPLGRLRRASGAWPLVLEKLPLLGLSAAAAALAVRTQTAGNALSGLENLPLGWRVANAAVSYCRYLLKTAWPADLAVFYPHPGGSIPPAAVAAAAGFLIAATLAALRVRRRAPWAATGWLWYAGMLVPVIGIVQVGVQALADRYTYLPLLGVFVAVAWGAEAAARRLALPAGALPAAAAAVVAALAGASFVQAGYWRDSTTLYTHAIAATGRNWLAEANLGYEDLRRGRWREAETRLRRVVEDHREIPEVYEALGVALMNEGDYPGARVALLRALELRPAYAEAESNLAWVIAREGRPDAAEARYRRALGMDPALEPALTGLGELLRSRGKTGEAADLYRRALAANPGAAKLWFNLGVVLAGDGRAAGAEEAYRAAIAADPGLAEARNNLGTLLFRQGRREEALRELRAALAAAPADAEIRANLATVEAAGGR